MAYCKALCYYWLPKGGGTYFHLGGGGGQRQKGHHNIKKGTNGAHVDN